MQVFAEYQPVSIVTAAVQALTLGGPTGAYMLGTVAWCTGILVLAVPFAVRRYMRAIK